MQSWCLEEEIDVLEEVQDLLAFSLMREVLNPFINLGNRTPLLELEVPWGGNTNIST